MIRDDVWIKDSDPMIPDQGLSPHDPLHAIHVRETSTSGCVYRGE